MPTVYLAAIGDSKTYGTDCCVAAGGYRDPLTSRLIALEVNDWQFTAPVYAVGGVTTATVAGDIAAYLDTLDPAKVPLHVLINLGTNDLPGIQSGSITQTPWVNNMGTILDAVHAKWPSAKVYLMRVYWSAYPAAQDTLDDTYIPAVLSGRGAWAFVGPDERTFIPGNTADGTHPNAHGYDLTAAEWQTVMGY